MFCCLPWSVGCSPVESSAEQMLKSPCEVGKLELEEGYGCKLKGCSEIKFCCLPWSVGHSLVESS